MGPVTQEDPIGIAGGLNLYGYANGDPINYSDPFGLRPCPWDVRCIQAAADLANETALMVGGWFSAALNIFQPGPEDALLAGAAKFLGAAVRGGGKVGREVVEQHHLLPKAAEFRRFFDAAGLDVEDFKIPLTRAEHRLKPGGLHTGPDNWNAQWRRFFSENPNATRGQILGHLDEMKERAGIGGE